MRVQFELIPFRSPLLRESQLISLPLPTGMLPFGRFPLLVGAPQVSPAAGSPIRVPPDRSLHAATRSISQLATPFFSAQAKPSLRWLIMPNLLWNPLTSNILRPMHGVHHDRPFRSERPLYPSLPSESSDVASTLLGSQSQSFAFQSARSF